MNIPHKNDSGKSIFLATFFLAFLMIGGAAGVWFSKNASAEMTLNKSAEQLVQPPVFVALDPFTINLQPEGVDHYLQASFTVQIADEKQVDLFNLYMAEMRSRSILLLAGKKASEISTVEGKNKLAQEIVSELNQPYLSHNLPQVVRAVFFTSFVIQ